MMKRPIEHCYWVVPGKLLAGEYPRTPEHAASLTKLSSLGDAGISRFVDLTEPADGMAPYEPLFPEVPGLRALRYSFPIRDESLPESPQQMREILDTIDRELGQGNVVYVHCWGGVGRTGTVIGCWLARHFGAKNALGHLASLWKSCPKSAWRRGTPETGEQAHYVQTWQEEAPASTSWRAVLHNGVIILE